jgi:hypothetical protein
MLTTEQVSSAPAEADDWRRMAQLLYDNLLAFDVHLLHRHGSILREVAQQ